MVRLIKASTWLNAFRQFQSPIRIIRGDTMTNAMGYVKRVDERVVESIGVGVLSESADAVLKVEGTVEIPISDEDEETIVEQYSQRWRVVSQLGSTPAKGNPEVLKTYELKKL